MKKLVLSFIITSVLFTSCGPTTNDAVQFNDSLIKAQKRVINSEKDFYNACDGFNPDEIKRSYENFSKDIDSSLSTIQNIKEEKEFASFKQSGLTLITSYKKLIPTEYKEYARLYSLPDGQYTANDSIHCSELIKKIDSTLEPLSNSFLEEQKKFAKEWNFILTK